MILIKTFDEYIKESVERNKTFAQKMMNDILRDIKKITPVDGSDIDSDIHKRKGWSFEIRWLDIKTKKTIENLLKRKQKDFQKVGMLFIYELSDQEIMDFEGDNFLDLKPTGEFGLWINMFVKDLYTKRYFPKRYLYHRTKKSNRESIREKGLEPKEFTSGNWTFESFDLSYPPTIFATETKNGWQWGGTDVWRIDTKGLRNKWWEDLNFYKNYDQRDSDAVMTFDTIPPNNLKLLGGKELNKV